MRGLSIALVLVVAHTAFAQEKAASGSDAEQGFASPLAVGTGATLAVGQESKTVTVGLAGQMKVGLNVWQMAFSGTTNDEGDGLAYSSSDEASPGWKGKIGIGYSSFQTTTTYPNYSMPGAVLLVEAWCVDVTREINKQLKTPLDFPSDPVGCRPVLDAVTIVFADGGLNANEKPDAAAVVRYTLVALSDLLSNPNYATDGKARITRQFVLCRDFKQEAAAYYPLCADGVAKSASIEDTRTKYPRMAGAIMPVTGVRALQYRTFFNWTPSVVSASYRPKVDGVVALGTDKHWTRLLHGVAFDNALYYKNVTAGIQASFSNDVDIKLAKVCKTNTQGELSTQTCKEAALGEPDPGKVLAVAGAISLDPLFGPGSLLRTGAQLTMRYQNPAEGVGHRTEIALPIYLAPIAAPIKLVIGVKPAWMNDTTNPENLHPKTFSVTMFVGARP